MPIPDGPFIFVSYSSKDSSFVHAEIKRLERQGYRVWYDKGELQPARFWDAEIREAITACTCFMVFITEDSVISYNVCDEIDQALKASKPFIGVYWDNVQLPDHLQKPVRIRQTLARYAMHQSAYEEPLGEALAEYTPVTIPPPPEPAVVPTLFTSSSARDLLPKLVAFGLAFVGATCLLLAVVVVVTPNIVSVKSPNDFVNNRLMGLILGITFVIVGLGASGAAVAVFRVCIWRRND